MLKDAIKVSKFPTGNTLKEKYQRAQNLMQGFWGRAIVPNTMVYPNWILETDCFWYERDVNLDKNIHHPDKPIDKWDKQYRLVNAKTRTNSIAFDHGALAAALCEVSGEEVNENFLPIQDLEFRLASVTSKEQVKEILFSAFGKPWSFETKSQKLTLRHDSVNFIKTLVSPCGKYLIFTRDYNLWLQDRTNGQERALTSDGEEHYCYGAQGNAWGHDMGSHKDVQARWSGDSTRIFTVQRDTRQVLTLPTVEHVPQDGSIRPKLYHTRIAMKGDKYIPEYRLVAIDVETGCVQTANYHQIPISRNSWGFFTSNLGWWATDNQHAYFIDLARDYKTVRVIEFDTTSGATRLLFEETSETQINLMVNGDEFPTLVPLPETNELIWFSERTGWAHLYLYDLKTGALKRQITSGDWVVRDVVSVDSTRRELFVQTMGRTATRDPYYRDLIRISMDTDEFVTVVSGDYDVATFSTLHLDLHGLLASGFRDMSTVRSVSHSSDFVVITRTRADSIPISLLVDRNGEEVMAIEKGDLSTLHARVSQSWQWPEPVKLFAADGKTNIYGLVYRPSDFDATQFYPIINHVLNTPDFPWVPKGSFDNEGWFGAAYFDPSALAELGFIVVQIDGRGASYRDKEFKDQSYGWLESASNLEDHIVGIQQLAERYPYMDLDRVGIYCSMGGAGAVQGLLQYPDFYKVGALAMPMHDSRLMPTSVWSDMYEWLSEVNPKYRYPEAYAEKLQGKLLMCQGMLDDGTTPPAITFRMVEALQKVNKDFDLLMLPNVGHSKNSYMIRRIWDYFVRYLQRTEPPKEFKLTTARDL